MSDTFTTSDFYGGGGEPATDDVAPTPEVEVPAEVAPEGAAPADDGGQGQATEQPVEKTFFDPQQFSDHLVKVTVNGEELEVPVAELPQAYMRQADYTRKTQELAQQRKELEFWQVVDQAARTDPQATLQILAQKFGIEPQAQGEEIDPGEADPFEQLRQELRQELAPVKQIFQQQQLEQSLNQVLTELGTTYGDAFDVDEVLTHAQQLGVYDPNLLDAVFKDLYFQKTFAQQAAQAASAQQQAAQTAARQQAAAQAAQVTGAPASSAAGVAPAAPTRQVRSVLDAWEMTKEQLAAQGLI